MSVNVLENYRLFEGEIGRRDMNCMILVSKNNQRIVRNPESLGSRGEVYLARSRA